MFCLAICDDEKKQRQYLRNLCESFLSQNVNMYNIIEFSSGEEMLSYFNEEVQPIHLLFLDVEMGEIDGIEVLRNLERNNKVWRVVFVSNHEDAVWDSFGIKTLGFGRKPVGLLQIEKWIQVVISEMKENIMISYIEGTKTYYIPLEDIYYLEAAGNYSYLHTMKDSKLINDKLKIWQNKLEQQLMVRIHKSYLINMINVKEWRSDSVTLLNGVKLAIGRQFAKEAKEKYLVFVKKQAMKRM